MPPNDDEIVAEVRRVREEHAAAHDYDLARILADLRKQERASDVPLVSLPPKKPVPLPHASGI
jgi:hypothetical protein